MKTRLFSLFLALVMLFSPLTGPQHVSAAAAAPYLDISIRDWYYQAVTFTTELKLMNGIGQGQFAPGEHINRAMFVTILHRLAGSPAASPSRFTDVPADSYFAGAVAWAAQEGIVNGTGATTFSPERPILRQDMACMLARYLCQIDSDVLRGEECEQIFLDMHLVSGYAWDSVELMRRTGLFQGDEASNFRPLDTANRAEAATLFTRLALEMNQVPCQAVLETDGGASTLSTEDTIWLYTNLTSLSWQEGMYAEYVPTHTLTLWNGEYRFCFLDGTSPEHINYVCGDAVMGTEQAEPLLLRLIYSRFSPYLP